MICMDSYKMLLSMGIAGYYHLWKNIGRELSKDPRIDSVVRNAPISEEVAIIVQVFPYQ